MKFALGRRLFFYTSCMLVVLLLLTLVIVERHQARQWEGYLRQQSISFARFATPEVLKLFRGDFSTVDAGGTTSVLEFLGFNRQLILFGLFSPGGRQLYRSPQFPDFIDHPFPEEITQPALERLQVPRLTVQTVLSHDYGRVLDLVVPAFGPTGQHLLAAQYLISYELIDQKLWEVRRQFAWIALLAILATLPLVALLVRQISTPIRALTEGVRAVAGGDLSARIPVRGQDEIAVLASAFNEMGNSLDQSQSELTRKNQALVAANAELRQIQDQLLRSERLATLGQLAAGVSHEIDNPVGIILGYAELLLDDLEEGDPRRADVEAIIAECRRCRRITGGLLGLARQSLEHRETLNLSELVNSVFSSLQPQKLFRHVAFEVNAESQPMLVDADADQLRQILINLLLNSAQAMDGQGRIVVGLFFFENQCCLQVCDSGPGVPGEFKEKVFEPFFSTKGNQEGTGLGLSLCRKLAEEHNGSLELISKDDGACFELRLPRHQAV